MRYTVDDNDKSSASVKTVLLLLREMGCEIKEDEKTVAEKPTQCPVFHVDFTRNVNMSPIYNTANQMIDLKKTFSFLYKDHLVGVTTDNVQVERGFFDSLFTEDQVSYARIGEKEIEKSAMYNGVKFITLVTEN
jgi:hypothetical protein